jgi:hypothetical protein
MSASVIFTGLIDKFKGVCRIITNFPYTTIFPTLTKKIEKVSHGEKLIKIDKSVSNLKNFLGRASSISDG